MSRLTNILAFLALASGSQAQLRNANWIVAQQAWLNFAGTNPANFPLSWAPTARNATMSDTLGNLLMVADETGLHDATFAPMPNGAAADLGWPAELSALMILPKPGDPDRYGVFLNTREDLKQAGYVEVDMSLNGGLGDVVGTTTWYASNITAKLAATPHQNGTDYWVLLHEDGSDAFLAFPWTVSGITPPVISHTGATFTPTLFPSIADDQWAAMKFNVAGDRIVLGRDRPDTDTSKVVSLFVFDDLTGIVGFAFDLDAWHREYDPPENPYEWWQHDHIAGVEFDASGSHLIAAFGRWSLGSVGYGSVQYQLAPWQHDYVSASATYSIGFGNGTTDVAIDSMGLCLNLAPDGSIYGRMGLGPWNGYLGVLTEPCLLGSNCSGTVVITEAQGAVFGLPIQCKRYHDSEPTWLGVQESRTEHPALRVRPNPLHDEAVLDLSGQPFPDQLRWRDSQGRLVRSEPAQLRGLCVRVLRDDLPSGIYILEALRHGDPVGRTRVILD